ncbi:PREDICTED: uncharacterized protein LOC108771644 [Cyphomyrmex costatus]|uniref:uncharacterized protein LOC108771644 n=1 Tax=Cyphomyrmex costatus TaxID=456900 RepID=UPI0008523C04|nr:PREDICTED: uncharacterized protein LOC108771644 [Cyphomyrmex costatus]
MKIQSSCQMYHADKTYKLEELTSMDTSIDSPSSPRPSTSMKYQPEMLHSVDKVFEQPKTLNFSKKHVNNEVIDVSSGSDTDSSVDCFKNFENSFENSDDSYDDISIINAINKTENADEPIFISSCSTFQLTDNDNTLLANQIKALITGSDRQVINNEIQDGPKEDVEENNDLHIKKKRSDNPRPGCSKDSGDTFLEMDDFCSYSNTDELLKDAKLIHALLPRYNYRLILRILNNNQFARNRIELTLWDLLPEERPLPQYLKRPKFSDEISFIEHKKKYHISLQKNQVDANTALEKKEQTCVKNEVIADNKKSDVAFASSTDENNEMVKNVSEVATSINNTTDQNMTPLKKTKLDHKSDESVTTVEDSSNINMIVPNSKISTSPEVSSETKELHLIENLEVPKTCKSDDKYSERYKVRTVVMPPKFTFQSNFTIQKDEKCLKSTTPVLSPPKLKVLAKNTVSTVSPPKLKVLAKNTVSPTDVSKYKPVIMRNRLKRLEPNITQTEPIISPSPNISSIYTNPCTQKLISSPNTIKQNEPIVHRVSHPWSLNPSLLASNCMLLDMLSNNKRASERRGAPLEPNSIHQTVNQIKIIEPQASKVTKEDGIKVVNVQTTQVLVPATLNASSSSIATVPSTSHDQKTNNMTTSQVYDKGSIQQHSSITQRTPIEVNDANKINWKVEQLETTDAMGNKKLKIYTYKDKPKEVANDAEQKEIVLNSKALKIYVKLITMFPTIKPTFIKKLCYDYVKDDGRDEVTVIANLVEILLNSDQKHLVEVKPRVEPQATTSKSYDMNEQYADLLMIFPEADPVYLRKIAEEIYNNPEQIKEFVQSKLENPDYPTRTQYLAKKKITQQQKQYTTDFQVKQFLEIFPDPFAYFEDDKRKCEFNPHAVDFLKYYFSKLRVNTLVKSYSQYMNNLSLTAKALEVLNPDMKTKRYCNKMTLTEDIPFLQECAFIQHKTELRKYLDDVKATEQQEFNELKAKNGLLECHCCYDDECMPSKCSTCEDGHVFCNSCIIRSTDVVLADGNTRVDCLLQCGCEFPLSVLQQVLPPTKFSILLCKRQEAEIIAAGVDGLVSCPFCHFASIPPAEDKIFKCLNPECMKESCRLCKELNHIPLKCNEKKAESARLYLEEKMTQALVRKCYRCSRMFFKEEGCNKMTCICGAQMCYICDKPVTDYKHFQGQGAERSNLCPLWSDDRRLNAEGVIKVCKETMKQIKEKDPHVDINVDALLPKLPPKSKGPHEDIQNALVGLYNRIGGQFL